MRRTLSLLALFVIVVPAAAQNTDIESLSGLQFNFGNPGARALGMGGAFLGLADDASAAEANPAGLTILRQPEVTLELRNYEESQLLTTSGLFPDFERTQFTSYSDRVEVNFASFVYPIKNFTIGGYYHQPLRNRGAGAVVPTQDEITGEIINPPSAFLNRDTRFPISEDECEKLRLDTNDFFACTVIDLKPFVTAVDIQQKTYGLAGAWQIVPKFSIGGAVRYQTFKEEALTFRFTTDGFGNIFFDSLTAQVTGDLEDGEIVTRHESDVTFSGGFKWTLSDKFSVGGVYKQGGRFIAPVFAQLSAGGDLIQGSDVTFHVPDVYGVGISFRPIQSLTINADGVRVKYSNLADDFVSLVGAVQQLDEPFKANDVVEIRLGAEYFFPTRIPFALRVGAWRDPAHSLEYVGPLNLGLGDGVAARALFPEGEDQNHVSVGAGLAWPRLQIDVAYDRSDLYKVGSISVVTRF